MTNKLLCTMVMLLGATALQATEFDFSYSGMFGGVTATGVITATATTGGNYNITSLTGTRNGVSISDSTLSSKGNFNYVTDTGSFDFLVSGSGVDTVSLLGGGWFSESGIPSATVGFNFSIVDPPPSAPESTTLTLLLTMGVAVWVTSRKFVARNTV